MLLTLHSITCPLPSYEVMVQQIWIWVSQFESLPSDEFPKKRNKILHRFCILKIRYLFYMVKHAHCCNSIDRCVVEVLPLVPMQVVASEILWNPILSGWALTFEFPTLVESFPSVILKAENIIYVWIMRSATTSLTFS